MAGYTRGISSSLLADELCGGNLNGPFQRPHIPWSKHGSLRRTSAAVARWGDGDVGEHDNSVDRGIRGMVRLWGIRRDLRREVPVLGLCKSANRAHGLDTFSLHHYILTPVAMGSLRNNYTERDARNAC